MVLGAGPLCYTVGGHTQWSGHIEPPTPIRSPAEEHTFTRKRAKPSPPQAEKRFQHFPDGWRPSLQGSNKTKTKPKPKPYPRKSNSRKRDAHFWSNRSNRLYFRSQKQWTENKTKSNMVGETTRAKTDQHSRKSILCSSKHAKRKQFTTIPPRTV